MFELYNDCIGKWGYLMCAGIIEQDTYKLKFFLIRDITILHYL